jgi:hypothetical protein
VEKGICYCYDLLIVISYDLTLADHIKRHLLYFYVVIKTTKLFLGIDHFVERYNLAFWLAT